MCAVFAEVRGRIFEGGYEFPCVSMALEWVEGCRKQAEMASEEIRLEFGASIVAVEGGRIFGEWK